MIRGFLVGFTFFLLVASGCPAGPTSAPAATGRLQLTFTEHSPLSTRAFVYGRYGALKLPPPDPQWRTDVDLATEPFDVYVSPAYKPDIAQGLFVWMGNTQASAEWMDVLARHKLIFLDAKMHDEKTDYGLIRKSLDGIHNLKQRYNIDEKRIFISGFSGGAGEASFTILAFPDVFRGGVFLMGGGFFYTIADGDNRRIASSEPRRPWMGNLDDIKQNFPLVMINGQRDPNDKGMTRAHYEGLIYDGFVRPTYIEIPNIGHNHPDAIWFEKAVNALDHPQLKKPPTTAPTNDPHPLASQNIQAKRCIASAVHYQQMKVFWGAKNHPRADNESRKYLQQVLDEYPTTPAAKGAREMLLMLDQPSSRPTRPK